ncbi:histidine kinase [Sporomusa sp. KB1]|jgi:mannose-6-phosphate isomerase-like protein (cupin superfamily)/ligand-binding sensor protein|uniref:histidine kinase n=1 Tax=Sporomusa sp. KB1 TaxID=943346 RepID=UPI0011A58326|nr:histidine kinase [Sporomusa sp. KB1]TWH45792.1 putative regulator of cell autolysis [Sporomusa sp. KB1]
MKIQKTEWGYIEWLYTHEESSAKQSMNVGIVVILPDKHQYRHTHTDEQLLYILDGEGIYTINDEIMHLHKGMYVYMEAGTAHETINTGTVPIRELLVSNPIYYEPQIVIDKYNTQSIVTPSNLYTAVEAIRTNLIETLNTPFTIYDETWSVVLQSRVFPNFCMTKCNPDKTQTDCACMLQQIYRGAKQLKCDQFVCPHGMTVYHFPIIYKNKCIGVIRGGHILLSDSEHDHPEGLYDTPQSTAIGIRRLLRQVAKNIASFCEFDAARRELQEKENAIAQTVYHKEQLAENLRVAQDTVTNLKINHHFLFNTLNSMANMALKSNSDDLYGAIIDLAKMFRYTMKSNLRFVALDSELGYLENYLNLQRLRYGQALSIEYNINDELRYIAVPFNFLQPIVENAFTHGFRNCDLQKRIRIQVEKYEECAVISIYNNGTVLDNVTLNRVTKGIRGNTGHGLSLIYTKLHSAYGEDFNMNIRSVCKEGTCVSIRVPIKLYEEAET